MANGQKVVVTNLDELEGLSLQVEVTPATGGAVPVAGRLYQVPPTIIPGITAADALDAGDQFGSLLQLAVPNNGVIVKALLHDLDNEGLGVEMWMFRTTVALAASDAAFALADADNLQTIDHLTWSSFSTATNNQVSASADVPCWYAVPNGILYCAFKSIGAPTIAAGSDPRVSLLIERYADD